MLHLHSCSLPQVIATSKCRIRPLRSPCSGGSHRRRQSSSRYSTSSAVSSLIPPIALHIWSFHEAHLGCLEKHPRPRFPRAYQAPQSAVPLIRTHHSSHSWEKSGDVTNSCTVPGKIISLLPVPHPAETCIYTRKFRFVVLLLPHLANILSIYSNALGPIHLHRPLNIVKGDRSTFAPFVK